MLSRGLFWISGALNQHTLRVFRVSHVDFFACRWSQCLPGNWSTITSRTQVTTLEPTITSRNRTPLQALTILPSAPYNTSRSDTPVHANTHTHTWSCGFFSLIGTASLCTVKRGKDGEDPAVPSCTLIHCCVCGGRNASFFYFFFSTNITVTMWRMRFEGGGDEGSVGRTEAGSTSTGAQEEWPPTQTLIRVRDKAGWINTRSNQLTARLFSPFFFFLKKFFFLNKCFQKSEL